MTKKLKTLWLFCGLLLCWLFCSAGVPPQKIPFQMVVRDNNNKLISNQIIGIRIKIKKESAEGDVVFSERHLVYTNSQGLATIVIGTGVPLLANLSDIEWGVADYFIETSVALDGSSDYQLSGTQQIMSVPYALYAEQVAFVDYDALQNKPSLTDTIETILQTTSTVADSLTNLLRRRSTDSFTNVRVTRTTPNSISLSADCISEWTIVDCGFCYDTNASPTIRSRLVSARSHTEHFECTISPLPANTRYHVRPYMQTAYGLIYGTELLVETSYLKGLCEGNKSVSDCDGNFYNTVSIGTQCWMREDLRTTHLEDGHSLLYYNGAKGYYQLDSSFFYSQSVILENSAGSNSVPSGIRGPCPAGWHVPSSAEWELLHAYVAGQSYNSSSVAVALAAQSDQWTKIEEDTGTGTPSDVNATGFNETGFSAVPTGYYNTDVRFGRGCINCQIGKYVCLAASSPRTVAQLINSSTDFSLSEISDYNYVPIRCLKD